MRVSCEKVVHPTVSPAHRRSPFSLTMKKNILFLCTGNSCRSQMAEALVNARFAHQADGWQAWSAGTKPKGFVHPIALQVLAELGIIHQGQSCTPEKLPLQDFDKVVTVCDAASDDCPVWLGQGIRQHVPFDDPAHSEDIQVFRRVRDEIAQALDQLLIEN